MKMIDIYTEERQREIARMSDDIDHDFALAASHACLIGNSIHAERNDRIVAYMLVACFSLGMAILIATAKEPIEPHGTAIATVRN